MSGDGDTRSMDDVLSAIRKIMKPEDEAEAAPAAGGEDDPLPLTSEMRVVEGGAEAAEEAGATVAEIVSEAQEAIGEAAAGAEEAPAEDEAASETEEAPEVSDEEAAPAAETEEAPATAETASAALDEGAIEAIVRRVVREELVEGDIGRNISENVKRLIQHEVAQALKDG